MHEAARLSRPSSRAAHERRLGGGGLERVGIDHLEVVDVDAGQHRASVPGSGASCDGAQWISANEVVGITGSGG